MIPAWRTAGTILLSGVLILLGATARSGDEPLPRQYLDKVASMPDFCQTDQRFGELPGEGSELCAPTALSNALVWLNQHGFPDLLEIPKPTQTDQADLIRALCEEDYLGTDLASGTPPKRVIEGIEKYFEECGYDCKVEQMGWRSSLRRIGKIPREKWLLQSCLGTSNVIINVGWYKAEGATYRRLGGHWVTLAGFKEDHGKRLLLIHDPTPRDGLDKKTKPCQLLPLPAHRTLHFQDGKSMPADGYFQLHGITLGGKADLAIVDGAVAFAPEEL